MSHVQPAVRTDGFLTAATGSQSLLAVPLVQGQRRLGVLVFGSSHPEKFARDDLIKAELLAAQAVVAMENAKLYGELARRLGEVEALYELSQATQRAQTAHDIACALLEILRHRLDFVHAAVYLSEGVGARWCRSPWPRTRGRSCRSTAVPGGASARSSSIPRSAAWPLPARRTAWTAGTTGTTSSCTRACRRA